jgi:hypothetical protein
MFPVTKHYELKWNYKKWAIEKWFEKEIMQYFRKDWFIVFHPQDVWLAAKFLDCHLVSPEWWLYWIEFKKIEKDTFNVSQFEDSQVLLLRELDKRNPDIAKVYIYSVKHNDYKSFTFTELWQLRNEKWGIKIFNNL